MTLLWICFALFLLYFVVFETWFGLTKYKKIMQAINDGRMPKTRLYTRLMTGLWIPAGIVVLLSATGSFTLDGFGLRWFKLNDQKWLLYIASVLAGVYFLYLVYSLVALRINAIKKVSISQKIPNEVKVLLPITPKEKLVWICVAITAGITEELLFRGFFFNLMEQLFPSLNVFIILVISMLIFGVGHLYQGVSEAVKPMLLGLVFGIFRIAFGTIIPCIILHAMQDLCAVDMINE